jgi:putative ABC transport system permease protein
MNSLSIALASIRSRPLPTTLCVATVAAGIALLCALFLLSQALSDGLTRNAKGVDIIVGSKGSKLQLVMSSLYHADIPAGNIEMKDFERLSHLPSVRRAIPLALGDNYKGWRMVGSTSAYLDLYHATVKNGQVFAKPFETVAGAQTGLKVGDQFAVSHGFSVLSDDVHDAHLYTVTGVLNPTGTALDRLLITPVESVQRLHAMGETDHDHDHDHEHGHHHDEDAAEEAAEAALAHQVTAVLIQVKNPVDILNLPRQINRTMDSVVAAVPSYEIAHFLQGIGLGRALVFTLAAGFVLLSGMMLLSSLSATMALRQYDLAVMRVLGARPARLFTIILSEGMIIAGAGAITGIIAGHIIAFITASTVTGLQSVIMPGTLLVPQVSDLYLALLGLTIGTGAAIIPAISAARTDIAGILAKGHM